MMNNDSLSLEDRVARLEQQLEAIAARMGERERQPAARPPGITRAAPASYTNPLASKSIEWWLTGEEPADR